jgi:monoamine oxidase
VSRSLFRRLHRLFGPRLSGMEQIQRVQSHRERVARALPVNLATNAIPTGPPRPISVGVVGAGFAGLLAGAVLKNLHCQVTLFEARHVVGGRVDSVNNFISNRILEKGAELIGSNHALWTFLAQAFGLGLSVITDDEQYAGMRLQTPVRLDGRRLSPAQTAKLYKDMQRAVADLIKQAQAIKDPYNPWLAHDAAKIDQITLESWIEGVTGDSLVRAALDFEFANNNAVATRTQSLLAILTQVAGAGGEAFWEDTEVYRCENGNVALANALLSFITSGNDAASVHSSQAVIELNVDGPDVFMTSRSVKTERPILTTKHDYVILAVPTSVLSSITFAGRPFAIGRIQSGPAVKYLAQTKTRYWIRHADAPSGVDSRLGMLWEGTDNQTGASEIDLTVFAGGPYASAIGTTPPDAYFPPKIDTLLPGFVGPEGLMKSEFANWPAEKFIATGYSCPAPGEVVTRMLWMQQPIAKRIFIAGEHASPPFFGYMEGALQSGMAAACRIADAAKLTVPSSLGTLALPGVRVQFPAHNPASPVPLIK